MLAKLIARAARVLEMQAHENVSKNSGNANESNRNASECREN